MTKDALQFVVSRWSFVVLCAENKIINRGLFGVSQIHPFAGVLVVAKGFEYCHATLKPDNHKPSGLSSQQTHLIVYFEFLVYWR